MSFFFSFRKMLLPYSLVLSLRNARARGMGWGRDTVVT